MKYKEEDIAIYHLNGVMECLSGEWLILNDKVTHEINQILLKYANDKTNRRTVKSSNEKMGVE